LQYTWNGETAEGPEEISLKQKCTTFVFSTSTDD